jgi:rhodanese-related sulfurtransferase
LYTRLKKGNITIVDVMDDTIHENVHIKDSINIPFCSLEHLAFKKLDPKDVIVTYSIDYECPVSRLAAKKLNEFGFKKTYYYPGGLKEWVEADLPVVRQSK